MSGSCGGGLCAQVCVLAVSRSKWWRTCEGGHTGVRAAAEAQPQPAAPSPVGQPQKKSTQKAKRTKINGTLITRVGRPHLRHALIVSSIGFLSFCCVCCSLLMLATFTSSLLRPFIRPCRVSPSSHAPSTLMAVFICASTCALALASLRRWGGVGGHTIHLHITDIHHHYQHI